LLVARDRSLRVRQVADGLRVPVIHVRGMSEAVWAVRHGSPAAVVLEHGTGGADALEMALNLRDVDERVPIFVIGCLPGSDAGRGIARLSGAFLTTAAEVTAEVSSHLAEDGDMESASPGQSAGPGTSVSPGESPTSA
jgi:hypothetical protein